MKKEIAEFAEGFPDTTVIDSNSSFIIIIKKGVKTFELTIPNEVNEIFYSVRDGNEEVFMDWNDYYMGDIEQRRNEKKGEIKSIIKLVNRSQDFRIKKAERMLDIDKLECFLDGQWVLFNERINPEQNAAEQPATSL